MYVYVSNESPQDVYFDDVTVTHTTGPLLQENHYYPFGLRMTTISDKAALKLRNNFLYNGGAELEDEDGITYYNTFYRKYDAQLGRFTGIDMLAESYIGLNPYQFGANNPVMFNDPMGDQLSQPGPAKAIGRFTKGPDGNYHPGWFTDFMWDHRDHFTDSDNEGGSSSVSGGNSSFTTTVLEKFYNFQMNDKSGSIFKNGAFGHWASYLYFTGETGTSSTEKYSDNEKANIKGLSELKFGREWIEDEIDYGSETDLNWFSNIKTAISMTGIWAMGAHNQETVQFSNNRVADAMRDAHNVNIARNEFYIKYRGVSNLKGASYTNYGGKFGLTELILAGKDPIEQFVGNFSVDIYAKGDNLQFILNNNSSFRSFAYGIGPHWEGGAMGNYRQSYIFTEPINRNRLK